MSVKNIIGLCIVSIMILGLITALVMEAIVQHTLKELLIAFALVIILGFGVSWMKS